MATSFTMTPLDIVTQAMRELKILSSGAVPTAEELADSIVRLNGMLKSWQGRGLGSLTRSESQTVIVQAGDTTFAPTIPAQEIIGIRSSLTGYDRPIQMIERDEYMMLPNKATRGTPSLFYAEPRNNSINVYLWPTPAIGTTLVIDYVRKLEAVTDVTAPLDISDDWMEAVYASLAVRLAGMFGAEITPELAQRAGSLEQAMFDADRPNSYIMEPW